MIHFNIFCNIELFQDLDFNVILILVKSLDICFYKYSRFILYSRNSIIWPSIIRISGLTEPKSCLPAYNALSTVSDNTGFYTVSESILVLYKTYHSQKRLTSLIFITIVTIGEGLIQLHDPATQLLS